MTLSKLPTEVLGEISKYLEGKDIYRLRMTCKRLYRDLERDFKTSKMYKVFLHNYYLGFHIMDCLHFVPESEYLKYFVPHSNSNFVISRIGKIWSWKNYTGVSKAVPCQCGKDLCDNLYFIVEPSLQIATLRFIIRNHGTMKSYIKYSPGLEEGCIEADKKLKF